MRRLRVSIFIVCIALDLAAGGFLAYKMKFDPQWLVDLKYVLFTSFTGDIELFNAPPDKLYRSGFKVDTPDEIEKWSRLTQAGLSYAGDGYDASRFDSDTDLARQIVLLFSVNGAPYCSDDIGLLERLKRLPGGYGCCTDHSEAFIVFSNFYGLKAREVHTAGHVTNEYYDQDKDKWIWIDPLYAISARGSDHELLSLSEIRDAYVNGNEADVRYDFFGTDKHYFKSNDPHDFEYFDGPEDFSTIMLTWGSNVFQEAEFYNSYSKIPKAVRQFLGLSMKVMPKYMVFSDKDSTNARRLKKLKVAYTAIFFILLSANIAALIALKSFIGKSARKHPA